MLIPHVKRSFRVEKIIYLSIDAKQNFKNKFQTVNLVHHEENFGVKADWNLYATTNGESASDGIGAGFKRQVARNSLLCKPTEAILTPEKLTEWGQKHFQNITTMFYSKIYYY